MKNKSSKLIAYILVIIWMGFIFFMSNQPADISNSQSDTVINILEFLGFYISDSNLGIFTIIVRKGAHVTEYFILSLLYYNLLRFYIDNKNARILSVILVFLYASTDEFHQCFISGRAGRFIDVLIDTTGGTLGSIIVYLFNRKKKWL